MIVKENNLKDHYVWEGFAHLYEVGSFSYNEHKDILTLWTPQNSIIVELSFEDSDIQMETFTAEEISEYLLDFFEEYK